MCKSITGDDKLKINQSYWNLGDLRLQRSFLANHVKILDKKRSKVLGKTSRRSLTLQYFLTVGNEKIPVCKKMFLGTLGMKSDRQVRTMMEKLENGTIGKDNRGGRRALQKANDLQLKESVESHLNSFPRVDAHYCRKDSSKQYLYPGLTLMQMHDMYASQQKMLGKPAASYRLLHSIAICSMT